MQRTMLGLFAFIMLGGWALAELPPLSAEKKKELATDIVSGEVKGVYEGERAKKDGFIDTVYVLEISASDVGKGTNAKKGEVFFVKTWKKKKRPDAWVGPGGQSWIPKAGDQVKVFAKREADGTCEVLLPNGIEKLTDPKK